MAARPNIILFVGKARENLRGAVAKWVSVFGEKYGETGITRVRGNELTPAGLKQELLSLPFLCEKRLVIIDGLPFSGETGGEEAAMKKEEKERYKALEEVAIETIPSVDSTSFIVFISELPDKKSKLYQFLETEASVKRFDPPTEYGIKDYITSRLPSLSRTNTQTLLNRIGKDTESLEAAIRKLELFSDESLAQNGIIDEAIAEKLELSVFSLSDELLAGKIDKALQTLDGLRTTYSLREIFIPLIAAVRATLYISKLRLEGKSDSEIAKESGVHPFVLSKRARLSAEKINHLRSLFDALVALEIGSKTGTLPGDNDEEILLLGISRAIFSWKEKK